MGERRARMARGRNGLHVLSRYTARRPNVRRAFRRVVEAAGLDPTA